MIVEVDLRTEPARARLLEPDDFKGFKLIVLDGGSTAAARLREVGIPRVEEHAWIPADVVRGLAGSAATKEWGESFAAMVEFARSRGWLDEELAAIRAHVERPGV